jgi:Cd2+/Zn2+-exporting ATPase
MSRAVAVLVVGCPGSFVLAGPTAMIAALAAASRLGILIKNTRFLESLADVDTVVLDKTGTVTLGRLELVGVHAVNSMSEAEILRAALPCANASRHPASRAVVRAGESLPSDVQAGCVEQVQEVPGKGVRASVDGMLTLLGRREWLVDEGIPMPENPEHSGPIVWLGRKPCREDQPAAEAVGCFLLADMPRPDAKEAIHELRGLGIQRAVLLTGDRRAVAEQVGEALEVDQVIAEVLPEQKLQVVREENEKSSVMMVGDGVNDALALASGDVGVALGAVASDVALQSADVALMTNDLRRLPMTVELARKTRRTIHQNVLMGAGISLVFVGLASAGLVTALTGAVLHNVGELFVIVNSARLLGFGRQGDDA